MKRCTCTTPLLAKEQLSIRCGLCGSAPREDLGGDDASARLAYRVKLNRLRSDEGKPAVLRTLSRSQRRTVAMQLRRKRVRELRAEGFSLGQIAVKVGVSTKTVQTDLDPTYAAAQAESNRRSRSTPKARQRKSQYMELWRGNHPELNARIIRECKERAAA